MRKCCGVSQKQWMLELSNLCHCVQHPWKLTSSNYWSSRNERKPLSQLKHVFRKSSGVSQKQWMLEVSNLCHCVQHPWKLTSREFWSSRNESKLLPKKKNVFWENVCGVSQKQWMLELSNLCHCVQHPWKLTSSNYWSSRNERKPLSQLKHVLRKCCGVSQKQWMLEFQTFAIVFSTPENLLVGNSGVLGMKVSYFLRKKMCFEKMLWCISEMVNARAFKPLPLWFSTPENLLIGISGALGTKESHFLS